MSKLSHLDERGQAQMVDIAAKAVSQRAASAEARVHLGFELATLLARGEVAKGDVLACARIAGIQAAKKTSDLIPLCHPLALSKVAVDFELGDQQLRIVTSCQCHGRTGVEMEALTAASVAALTVYDMCKAVDKGIVIESLRLLSKSGGKSGDWRAHAD